MSNLRRMWRGSCCATRSPRAAFLFSESVSVTSGNFSALVDCCYNYQRRFQTEYLRQLLFAAVPPQQGIWKMLFLCQVLDNRTTEQRQTTIFGFELTSRLPKPALTSSSGCAIFHLRQARRSMMSAHLLYFLLLGRLMRWAECGDRGWASVELP